MRADVCLVAVYIANNIASKQTVGEKKKKKDKRL